MTISIILYYYKGWAPQPATPRERASGLRQEWCENTGSEDWSGQSDGLWQLVAQWDEAIGAICRKSYV
ncbi:hypothetical protein M132_1537 [Bacteroides fragilis str. S24L15]|uniref:hypothetical protein n=1 Tax=Bacteroides fragilis TaxID=817 RepID=UPI000450DC32|nr:hypothetical protein [Bacteroides fragilis]EYA71726.1 hypothetical protein M132_1537 [Bacteroides fragilis str. S24L15]EYA74017.1 hypothetical protein M133_3805 [Bacteroides fragilis str. S24L26]EYA78603.1 hypothetical protein M134_3905 [Bacteroides fragilis str. S24L34]